MAIRVTHELHSRRLGRNVGVAVALIAFAALMFALTVVKVQNGGQIQGYDHTIQPELLPQNAAPEATP